MPLPLVGPVRAVWRAALRDGLAAACTGALVVGLLALALGLILASGLAALSGWIGFPLAALVFAAGLAGLALSIRLVGQARQRRRARRQALMRRKLAVDIATCAAVLQEAKPALPVAGFIVAFLLAYRRRP